MAKYKLPQADVEQQPDENGGSTPTTTSTTTATSSTGNPYEQFKGSTYDDVIGFIKDRMDEYKPESEVERKKREKREKREMFLANIANVLGNMHKSYSYQRGVKPMDTVDVSAKVRERFEKAKADREKENDRVLNYAITLGNLKAKDRDFNFRVTDAEQHQSNWREQFNAGRKDREEDVAYRDKVYADSRKDREEDVSFRDKQFEEGKRQFDISSSESIRHNKAQEGLERKRIAASQDGKYTEFYTGNGMVRIENTRLNRHNISYVFSKTPSAGRPTVSYDSSGKATPLSADQMMDWIGSNIDDQNVQSALRAIGGVTTTKDNTPPSRRNDNSNTPPSRR